MYRQHAAAYDALSGRGARLNGGRWNAPGSFEVIYTALDERAVAAELRRQLATARLTPASLRDRRLSAIEVDLQRVLDLRDPDVKDALGVSGDDLTTDDPAVPRSIGQQAFEAGFEAILAPSATGEGDVLAILLANRQLASSVELLSQSELLM